MKPKKIPAQPLPQTGSEEVPPGATTRAADRPRNLGRGAPGSGGGPRHAANDPGSPDESYEATDTNDPLAEPLPDVATPQEGQPFGGFKGGAVGGTPAGKRSTGGNIGPQVTPDAGHPGDSTVGTEPTKAKPGGRKSKKRK